MVKTHFFPEKKRLLFRAKGSSFSKLGEKIAIRAKRKLTLELKDDGQLLQFQSVEVWQILLSQIWLQVPSFKCRTWSPWLHL